MTKKHLIALADVIRDQRPEMDEQKSKKMGASQAFFGFRQGRRLQYTATLLAIADFCKSQNPNFNRQRWLDYIDGKCGPNGGKLK